MAENTSHVTQLQCWQNVKKGKVLHVWQKDKASLSPLCMFKSV